MITRRDFIKTVSLLSGAVLAPVRWLGKWAGVQPAQGEEPPEQGELYAGFVLLPEGALAPPFSKCASAPILCVAHDKDDPKVEAFRGETLWFNSIEELTSNLSFQTYVPTSLPANIEFVNTYLVRFVGSKEIFKARIDFGFLENMHPLIGLSAQPIFPQPLPIWPVYEKVDFTPTPGVMLPTAEGHVFQWIKEDILYTLMVEYDQHRDVAVNIAKSLVER
jgi:hypothetical protein